MNNLKQGWVFCTFYHDEKARESMECGAARGSTAN
ncbi:hypothetical protein ACHAXS_013707 [Conticribra weissflogii]